MISNLSLKWKLVFYLTAIGFITSFGIHLSLYLLGSSDITYTMRQSPIQSWQKQNIEQPITKLLTTSKLKDTTLQSPLTLKHRRLDIDQIINPLLDSQHTVAHRDNFFTHLTIRYYALVDINSMLVYQSEKADFNFGDLGSQLPIASRDDLSDALQGRNNSGIEPLSKAKKNKQNEVENYLIIKPLKNEQGDVLGAIISEQSWKIDETQTPLFYISIFEVMLLAFGLTVVSFLWILPSTIILGFLVAYVVSKKLAHFNSTISYWEKGNFLPQLNIYGNDEIAQSFKRLNLMTQKLESHQNELKELAGIEERQHLAAELHDTVKQQLFALNLNLSSAEQLLKNNPKQAEKLLKDSIKQNQVTFNQINQLILSLNPVSIGGDLISALKQSIKHWEEQTQITVDTHINFNSELSEIQQQVIFRSINEALQNIFKHSQPKQVKVKLTQNKNNIYWQVSNLVDKHFDIEYGHGLTLMKNRLSSVNGELKIALNPQKTCWTFDLSAQFPYSN